MNKKEAVRLDNILNGFTLKAWRIRVTQGENELCEKLASFGYVEIYSRDKDGYFILLTDKGNEFKAAGGFARLRKAKQIKTLKWVLPLIIATLGVLVSLFF